MSEDPVIPPETVRAAAEQFGVGHGFADQRGYVFNASGALLDMAGLTEEDLLKGPWFLLDRTSDEKRRRRAEGWSRFIQGTDTWHGMIVWHRPDGGIRHIESTAMHVDNNLIMLVMLDRTDRAESNQRADDSQRIMRQTLQHLPLAVAVTDLDDKVTYMNDYLPQRLNRSRESFYGKTLTELFGNRFTELAKWFIERFDEHDDQPEGIIEDIVTEAGEEQAWLVSARPLSNSLGEHVANLNVAIERTESRRLRREHAELAKAMYEAQKISALNDFAGSLAHELSNILHPVGYYARQLAAHPEGENVTAYARKVDEGIVRAREILRRTLTLADGPRKSETSCDVTEIVRETIMSAAELSPSSLTHVLHAPDTPIFATIKASELRQVLVNLLNNAAEAMHFVGTVTVRLEHIAAGTPDAGLIQLQVSDEGPGINPEIRDRLFDPFVTTKPPGSGTGLGLAVVQKLVETWGGTVTIGAAGVGTTFCVVFPAMETAPFKERAKSPPEES